MGLITKRFRLGPRTEAKAAVARSHGLLLPYFSTWPGWNIRPRITRG